MIKRLFGLHSCTANGERKMPRMTQSQSSPSGNEGPCAELISSLFVGCIGHSLTHSLTHSQQLVAVVVAVVGRWEWMRPAAGLAICASSSSSWLLAGWMCWDGLRGVARTGHRARRGGKRAVPVRLTGLDSSGQLGRARHHRCHPPKPDHTSPQPQ